MILRVVSGQVSPGGLDEVAESFRRAYVPIAVASPGLVRFIVGARPSADGGHHIAALTLWATVEHALAAYAGNLAAIRTLDGAKHGEHMTRVDYYEVDATAGAGLAAGQPALLRLTAGRVARGLDADIQQELRRNLPDLPPEATEAWVGRRVLDGDVEIAFVSTWTCAPQDRPLDEALWPSISARYDSFAVTVQTILVDGVGRI